MAERKSKPAKATKESTPKGTKKRPKDLDVPADKGAQVEAGKRAYYR
jgi:hypothetical protein